jgi:hypothetical protein
MVEPTPADSSLAITDPDHVRLLANLQAAAALGRAGVTGYRPIVFGGPLIDALRTGSPIPRDAELHIYVNGDIDQRQLLRRIEDLRFTINGLHPMVIDIAAPTTSGWERSSQADQFAYDTGCLTEIIGLDHRNRPQLQLEPIYLTNELSAIATALATVDDRTNQISQGITHDASPHDQVTALVSVDGDRRAWLHHALYLLAIADHDIIEHELDGLTYDELQFVSSLLDTHVALPRIEEILVGLADGSQYELVVDARSSTQRIMPALHERALALDPGPETLRSRARRFLGLESHLTAFDLRTADQAGAPVDAAEPALATVYDFVAHRTSRMNGPISGPER